MYRRRRKEQCEFCESYAYLNRNHLCKRCARAEHGEWQDGDCEALDSVTLTDTELIVYGPHDLDNPREREWRR